MNDKPRRIRENVFVLAVIIVWAAAFGVFLVNSPSPSILGLSSAYAYSLMWWIVAILVLIIYAIYDLRGG